MIATRYPRRRKIQNFLDSVYVLHAGGASFFFISFLSFLLRRIPPLTTTQCAGKCPKEGAMHVSRERREHVPSFGAISFGEECHLFFLVLSLITFSAFPRCSHTSCLTFFSLLVHGLNLNSHFSRCAALVVDCRGEKGCG